MKTHFKGQVCWFSISIISLFLIGSLKGYGQVEKEKESYHFKEPGFDGEANGLSDYITQNLKVRSKDFRNEVTGKVIAVFTLQKDNAISHLRMVDSTSSDDVNRMVMDLLKRSREKWFAAKINDEQVDVDIMVNYKLAFTGDAGWSSYSGFAVYWLIKDPLLATAFYNAGVAEAGSERFSEATKYFDEALLISPNDIDALFNRGISKFKAGDQPGGCEDWKRIRSLGRQDADKLLSKYCDH